MSRGQIVDTDYLVQQSAIQIQAWLNLQSALLGAYNTQIDPTPATLFANIGPFECHFDTYSRLSIAGAWAFPFQQIPGLWGSQSPTLGWASPTTTGDVIAGLFVVDGLGNLLMVHEYATPINFNVGDPAVNFIMEHDSWARSLLP